MEKVKCLFCEQSCNRVSSISADIYLYECPNCGDYKLTGLATETLREEIKTKYKTRSHLLSGYLREMNDNGVDVGLIKSTDFEEIYQKATIKQTLIERLNRLMLWIYRRTDYLFQPVDVPIGQPAIAYAYNQDEMNNLLQSLTESGYINHYGGMGSNQYQLTTKGFERAEKLSEINTASKQCFVALWFSEDMLKVYDESYFPVISDCGYTPIIISRKEHNDDVCDQIIAEIRRSRFLIADFTGNRGGVYFEAGFAYGIGLPVIYSCRDDWFNKELLTHKEVVIDGKPVTIDIPEKRIMHFDINHYNFIVWKDGSDLQTKLRNRIMATII